MLKKMSRINLMIVGVVFFSFASAACSALPSTSTVPQPLAGLLATPTAAATPIPVATPEASQKGNKGNKNAGAVAAPFRQLGLEAGVVAKTTSSQITLKAGKGGAQPVLIGS